jgi:hypothetical protein
MGSEVTRSIALVAEYEKVDACPDQRDEDYQQDQHRFREVIVTRPQHIADGDDVEDEDDQAEEHAEK